MDTWSSLVLFVVASVLGTLSVLKITAMERRPVVIERPMLPLVGRMALVALSFSTAVVIAFSMTEHSVAVQNAVGALCSVAVGSLLGGRVDYQRSKGDWGGFFYAGAVTGLFSFVIAVIGPEFMAESSSPADFKIIRLIWVPGLGAWVLAGVVMLIGTFTLISRRKE